MSSTPVSSVNFLDLSPFPSLPDTVITVVTVNDGTPASTLPDTLPDIEPTPLLGIRRRSFICPDAPMKPHPQVTQMCTGWIDMGDTIELKCEEPEFADGLCLACYNRSIGLVKKTLFVEDN